MPQITEMIDPVSGEIIDQKQIAEQLLTQAKEQRVSLVGQGGLMGGLTKTVLETAFEVEMTEHLGYEKHHVTDSENARNGTEVVALAMAPESSTASIRRALAIVAASAVHVVDEQLVGADLGLTAEVLAAAIPRAEPDLLISGNLSTDASGG